MVFKVGSDTVINDKGLAFNGQTVVADASISGTEVKITADDGAANDKFGNSVAVGSGRIVVGAYLDDIGSNTDEGSAYIFDLDGNQLEKIEASDGAASDQFGYSVAIGSGRIVVGAYGDNIGSNTDEGSAYIFDLDGTQITKITASDGNTPDRFGGSVAVGSGRIVVGAPNQSFGAGAAYIFDLDGNQLEKITASDGASNDYFGSTVAVGCGRVVVGADSDDVGSNTNQGSAYIFDLDGNELKKITASDGNAGSSFGYSVAVGSGRIVVSAYLDDLTGSAYIFDLDGNQLEKITPNGVAAYDAFGYSVAVGSGRIVVGARGDDSTHVNQGAVYIFDLDGNQLTKITASDAASTDNFGTSVAVGSGKIVVGAWQDDVGINSNQGSAYIYDLGEPYEATFEKLIETHGKE